MFNLHKFLRFEGRDPFQEKQKRDGPFQTDWDRFAFTEYHRLAADEDGYDNNGQGGSEELSDTDLNMDIDDSTLTDMLSSGAHGHTTNDWYLDDDDEEESDIKASGGRNRKQYKSEGSKTRK